MRKTADHCLFQKDVIHNQYPKLNQDIKTDVLIVGGGVSGALTAFMFKEQNIDVTLVEKETVATGSTLASTSLLHYEIDTDLNRLSALVGETEATSAFKLCLDAVGRLGEVITHLNDSCDFILRPSFYYTNKDEEYDYVYDEYLLRKSKGFDVTFYDGKKEADKFTFPFKAGIFSNDKGAEVNPVKLTNELLSYCHKKDMPIYDLTGVVEYDLSNDKPVAITEYGLKIECNKIILASGYDNIAFMDEDLYDMTRTFILATKPVDSFDGWHERCLIKDTADAYSYLRTTVDNRIIIGGEDIEVTLNDHDTLYMKDNHGLALQKYNLLKKRLEDFFPLIKDKVIDNSFNGIFIDSHDGLPYIGEQDDYPNMYFNTAIGSNGLLYGLIGAELILKQYLGIDDDDISKLFSFDRASL